MPLEEHDISISLHTPYQVTKLKVNELIGNDSGGQVCGEKGLGRQAQASGFDRESEEATGLRATGGIRGRLEEGA